LARLVADGNEWAAGVERWRQENPGRALTENQRKRLREIRDKDAKRQKLTAADDADVQAIVEAYVEGQRRIISDTKFCALATHYTDAKAILPDTRRLADRAAFGDWRPTPAQVVAHRLESYLREPRNGPAFQLKWLFARTEQDDLPRPPARAAPKRCACGHAEREHMGGPVGGQCLVQDNSGVECPCIEFRLALKAEVREGAIGVRRGPVLKPTPPPADVAGKIAEFTRKP